MASNKNKSKLGLIANKPKARKAKKEKVVEPKISAIEKLTHFSHVYGITRQFVVGDLVVVPYYDYGVEENRISLAAILEKPTFFSRDKYYTVATVNPNTDGGVRVTRLEASEILCRLEDLAKELALAE